MKTHRVEEPKHFKSVEADCPTFGRYVPASPMSLISKHVIYSGTANKGNTFPRPSRRDLSEWVDFIKIGRTVRELGALQDFAGGGAAVAPS
ncbi:hypothetical protein TNCV_2897981 [Trichonephila clavipes]|nr:hypothetical protein TNCV_2897981 [Trichonephila clavipes]